MGFYVDPLEQDAGELCYFFIVHYFENTIVTLLTESEMIWESTQFQHLQWRFRASIKQRYWHWP